MVKWFILNLSFLIFQHRVMKCLTNKGNGYSINGLLESLWQSVSQEPTIQNGSVWI